MLNWPATLSSKLLPGSLPHVSVFVPITAAYWSSPSHHHVKGCTGGKDREVKAKPTDCRSPGKERGTTQAGKLHTYLQIFHNEYRNNVETYLKEICNKRNQPHNQKEQGKQITILSFSFMVIISWKNLRQNIWQILSSMAEEGILQENSPFLISYSLGGTRQTSKASAFCLPSRQRGPTIQRLIQYWGVPYRLMCTTLSWVENCKKYSPLGMLIRNHSVQQVFVLLREDFQVPQDVSVDHLEPRNRLQSSSWRKWNLLLSAALVGPCEMSSAHWPVDWCVILWVLFRQLCCQDFMGVAPMSSSTRYPGSLALTIFLPPRGSSFCQLSFIVISLNFFFH